MSDHIILYYCIIRIKICLEYNLRTLSAKYLFYIQYINNCTIIKEVNLQSKVDLELH